MPNYDKRLERLEQTASSEDANVIVVHLSPGEDDAAKTMKIAEAKHSLGLTDDDPRRVIVVRYGADDGRERTEVENA
jgi:hypothetical protein